MSRDSTTACQYNTGLEQSQQLTSELRIGGQALQKCFMVVQSQYPGVDM